MPYEKPVPAITREDRPFWDAAREHRLVLPRCNYCGHTWFPPYMSCPACLSLDLEYVDASGRGTVWGYTIMRHPYIESFAPELPYNVVLVQLEEGPMVYSNLIDIAEDDIEPDLAVEAVFEDVSDDLTLVKFRPTKRA